MYENFKPQGIEAIWWTLKLRYWYGGSGVFSHFNKAEMKIILKSINIYILDTMKGRIGSDTTFKTQSIIILTEIGTTWSMHDWFHIDYSYSYSESYGISVLGFTDIIYRGGERTSCGQLDRTGANMSGCLYCHPPPAPFSCCFYVMSLWSWQLCWITPEKWTKSLPFVQLKITIKYF